MVWSAPFLKPLDENAVSTAAREVNGLVTIEEHSVLGGLGAAVTEITSQHQPSRVLRIGVPVRFSKNCGTHAYLLLENGLDIDATSKRIGEFCQLSTTKSVACP